MKLFVFIVNLILLHINNCNLKHIGYCKNHHDQLCVLKNQFEKYFNLSFFIFKIFAQEFEENPEAIFLELFIKESDKINHLKFFCTKIIINIAKHVDSTSSPEKLNLLITKLKTLTKDKVLLKKHNKAIAKQINPLLKKLNSQNNNLRPSLQISESDQIQEKNNNPLKKFSMQLSMEKTLYVFMLYYFCLENVLCIFSDVYMQINDIFESCFNELTRTYAPIHNNVVNSIFVVQYKILKQIYDLGPFYLYEYIDSSKTDLFLLENIAIFILKVFFMNNYCLLENIKKLIGKNEIDAIKQIKDNKSYFDLLSGIKNMKYDTKIKNVIEEMKKCKKKILTQKINYISTYSKIEIEFISMCFIIHFIGYQNLFSEISTMFCSNIHEMVDDTYSDILSFLKKEIKNDSIDQIYIYTA